MEDQSLNSKFEFRNSQLTWLILGLGNPGSEYARTLHNVGFRVLERLASELRVGINEWFGEARISRTVSLGGRTAVLVLPQTYMNRSGAVMPDLLERFGTTTECSVVVYDDAALPLGKIRVRRKGSAGGHNGLKSIISTTGSDEFMRVRVGIGSDREISDLRDFVLSPAAKVDQDLLHRAETTAASAVETLLADGIDKAMAMYNGIDLRDQATAKDEEK